MGASIIDRWIFTLRFVAGGYFLFTCKGGQSEKHNEKVVSLGRSFQTSLFQEMQVFTKKIAPCPY